MKTGLITSDTYQNHDTGPGHPEQIARVTVINENFKKLNNKNILWKKPSLITDDIIKDVKQFMKQTTYVIQVNNITITIDIISDTPLKIIIKIVGTTCK